MFEKIANALVLQLYYVILYCAILHAKILYFHISGQ